MLTIDKISFSYNSKKILRNVSFSLLPGAIITLHGPNGIGKSTLLKIIAGMLKPTTGQISWNQININEDIYSFQTYNVGFIDNNLPFKDDLTIKQNLEFYASLNGNYELIMPAISNFDLIKILDIKFSKLSAGLKQRVLLSKLIIDNKNLWILDEPDTHLDSKNLDKLRKLIAIKARDGGIILIASHVMKDLKDNFILNLEDYEK